LDADFLPGFHLLLGATRRARRKSSKRLSHARCVLSRRRRRAVIRHGAKGYFVGGKSFGQASVKLNVLGGARTNLSLDASR